MPQRGSASRRFVTAFAHHILIGGRIASLFVLGIVADRVLFKNA
jgi:hypothetical protein